MPQHLGFAFLPEERPALLTALEAHPSVQRIDTPDDTARFAVAVGDSVCIVVVGSDFGTLEYVAGDGDAAAARAQELLVAADAVFTTCC
ncbi:MAG: hypothetical protein GX774_01380 [Armatimonadetes bacterium]|nr:hypothetical protein [Armatimonadota bacterium]